MPTVHLIHGYLGTGKTTLAKQLAEEVNGVRFNSDEWMVRLHGEDPPDAYGSQGNFLASGLRFSRWAR
jgi:predicted kinase